MSDDTHVVRKAKGAAAICVVNSVLVTVMTTILVLKKHLRRRTDKLRAPRVNREDERRRYIDSLLYNTERHCIEQIRMSHAAFTRLSEILANQNLLHPTLHMSVSEQLLIFLHLIGHNMRMRVIGGRFYRSKETVYRYFHIVIRAVLKFHKEFIKLPTNETPVEIRNNPRFFFPYFQDCIGALDGTHIRASVPPEIQGRFRGREKMTTQNVLAAIGFDLKFQYLLPGWEGSAHDSRILNDALTITRPGGLRIPQGKYYLADAGYGTRNGVVPPYRGVRYHLREYSDQPPTNEKEFFNLRHSSLRMAIERGFGVFKRRFRVLDSEPFWSFKTQVKVVLACSVLHNYIMATDLNDPIMEEENHVTSSELDIDEERLNLTQRGVIEEYREWAQKRDEIALAIWNDYRGGRINQ